MTEGQGRSIGRIRIRSAHPLFKQSKTSPSEQAVYDIAKTKTTAWRRGTTTTMNDHAKIKPKKRAAWATQGTRAKTKTKNRQRKNKGTAMPPVPPLQAHQRRASKKNILRVYNSIYILAKHDPPKHTVTAIGRHDHPTTASEAQQPLHQHVRITV